jgi:NAD(P)-dependent dehydrogenase (short-subunit alcohol dehydrogenase family)
MRAILVVGGAGTFGARVVRLLAPSSDCRIIVGGRDPSRATALLKELGQDNIDVQRFDRLGDVAAQLDAIKPWLVIDAAGPFQYYGAAQYALPRACIALGIHYIDLADSRRFVAEIGTLNDAARKAQVTVISGASSVPALTMAIVAEITRGLDTLDSVDIALSASNRATAGPNVAQAILSYVGKPIALLKEGRWRHGHGWQELTRKSFEVEGRVPIRRRWVGLCEVPDLDLLPRRYPTLSNVTFRAGAELGVQNLVLWLLSFAVRWGVIPDLGALGPFFIRLQRLFGSLGTDRSAMSVRVIGRDRMGEAREATWTLIAENGHGPWVPSFAAVIAAQKLLHGQMPVGAFPASDVLRLADFADLLGRFHLFTETRHSALPAPLYTRVMGAAFVAMPPQVRAMHQHPAPTQVAGRGSVSRGDHPAARLVGCLFRFPPAASDVPVTVAFDIRPDGELWRRDFGGHRFCSRLSSRPKDGRHILTETFWPFTFDFDLDGHADGLDMHIRGWRLLGLPLPRRLAPIVRAHERVADGCFTFDVEIALPWGPLVVRYRGFLASQKHVSNASYI